MSVAAGSRITGRIHPTTLGPSANDEIMSRTGRVRPSRVASLVATASTGPSAGSPERRSTATCFAPQARRTENRITPRAHTGIAHELSEASQFDVDAVDPVQTAATVCGTVARNR